MLVIFLPVIRHVEQKSFIKSYVSSVVIVVAKALYRLG